MFARWLAPVFALAALVGLAGNGSAKNGDIVFEFSTDPVEAKGNLSNLEVRPNTAQPFYLFVRNKSDDIRDITVEILGADKRTILAEAKLMRVPRHTNDKPNAVRVTLAKPAPKVPAAGAAPVAAPPMAAAPMPNPMIPPPPPGIDLKPTVSADMTRRDFVFHVRAFDDRDKDNPSETIPIVIGVRQPTDYVKPVALKYEKTGDTNLLTVEMKSDGTFAGADPCPVDLVFPPQRIINTAGLREGVFRRPITGKEQTAKLYARNMPLIAPRAKAAGEAPDQGIFYVNIDNVPRAYVYRYGFLVETKDAAIEQLAPAAIRFMEGDKIDAPDVLMTRPRILPLRVEPDTTLNDATIEVAIKQISRNETVEVITRDATRDRRVFLDAAGMEGGVFVTTRVGDWVLPLDLSNLRGRYTLRAELKNNKREVQASFERTLVVDDTKPEKVAIEVLPGRDPKIDPVKHLRTKPIPIRVTASDPESGISRVVVFLGKVGPDGKLPEGVVDLKLLKEGGDIWMIDVPLPPAAPPMPPPMPGAPVIVLPPKLLDVTTIVVNGVGILSEPISMRIQILDPPTGATIKVTAALSKYGKALTGVKVAFIDSADGKEKGAGTTDEKTGEIVFKDVAPGSYRILGARPDAGVGTKGEEGVRVLAGDEKAVRIILGRRP